MKRQNDYLNDLVLVEKSDQEREEAMRYFEWFDMPERILNQIEKWGKSIKIRKKAERIKQLNKEITKCMGRMERE